MTTMTYRVKGVTEPRAQALLLALADKLEQVPTEDFSLTHWRCGSVACAIGWACTLPEFQAEGLQLIHGQPQFRNFTSWTAVKRVLGVDVDTALGLFSEHAYASVGDARAVAQRLRTICREGEWIVTAGLGLMREVTPKE